MSNELGSSTAFLDAVSFTIYSGNKTIIRYKKSPITQWPTDVLEKIENPPPLFMQALRYAKRYSDAEFPLEGIGGTL